MADDKFQYIKLPDGSYGKFDAGATDDYIRSSISKDFPNAFKSTIQDTVGKTTGISAQPKPFSEEWFKQGLWRSAATTADYAPAAGATIGTMAGAGGGPETAMIGAGTGGMGGTAVQQLIRRALGYPNVPQTSGEAAKDIGTQGLEQTALQGINELMPGASNALKGAAEKQYERALYPTSRETKVLTRKVVPGLIERGDWGGIQSLMEKAEDKIAELNEQLDAAYGKATTGFKRPEVKGLLQAAPTDIPLGPKPEPGQMPMELFSAKPYPRSAVSGGTPNVRLSQELGPAAHTIPPRIYRPAYTSGVEFGDVLGDVEQPTTGVMQSRDPKVINQVYPQTGAPYPRLESSPVPGASQAILKDLADLRGEYIVNGKVAQPQAVKAIEGIMDIVRDQGADISPNSLRKLKRIFDDPVAHGGGYVGKDLSTSYALRAQKAAADSIREIMSQASPDVAKLNKEVSFWLNVQKVTSESGLRQTGQQGGLLKVLSPAAGATVGAATGAAHGTKEGIAAGLVTTLVTGATQIMRSPAWRTASAVVKDRIAQMIARGDVQAISALSQRLGLAAGQAAYQGGGDQETQGAPQ